MADTPPIDPLRRAIGQRLAEERVGLKLSQDEFAKAVGKSRRAVAAWEAGEQSPDALVLAQAADVGVDVLFVVTGRRGGLLSEPQQLLVSYTSGMDTLAVNAAVNAIRGFAAYATDKPELLATPPHTDTPLPDYGGAVMTFNAPVDHAAGRDIHVKAVTFRGTKKDRVTNAAPAKKPHK
jgi:transcriptional regulator with XRE-family HTH domain